MVGNTRPNKRRKLIKNIDENNNENGNKNDNENDYENDNEIDNEMDNENNNEDSESEGESYGGEEEDVGAEEKNGEENDLLDCKGNYNKKREIEVERGGGEEEEDNDDDDFFSPLPLSFIDGLSPGDSNGDSSNSSSRLFNHDESINNVTGNNDEDNVNKNNDDVDINHNNNDLNCDQDGNTEIKIINDEIKDTVKTKETEKNITEFGTTQNSSQNENKINRIDGNEFNYLEKEKDLQGLIDDEGEKEEKDEIGEIEYTNGNDKFEVLERLQNEQDASKNAGENDDREEDEREDEGIEEEVVGMEIDEERDLDREREEDGEEDERSRSQSASSSSSKKFPRSSLEDELRAIALWAIMLRETGARLITEIYNKETV